MTTIDKSKGFGNMLIEEVLYKYSPLMVKYFWYLDDDLFYYTCEGCLSESGFHLQYIRRSDGMTISNFYLCQDCLYPHLVMGIIVNE